MYCGIEAKDDDNYTVEVLLSTCHEIFDRHINSAAERAIVEIDIVGG
jgi:hypothetical protein